MHPMWNHCCTLSPMCKHQSPRDGEPALWCVCPCDGSASCWPREQVWQRPFAHLFSVRPTSECTEMDRPCRNGTLIWFCLVWSFSLECLSYWVTLPGKPCTARFHQRVLYPGDLESMCEAAACRHVATVTSHLQGTRAVAADSGGKAGLCWRTLSHAFDGI